VGDVNDSCYYGIGIPNILSRMFSGSISFEVWEGQSNAWRLLQIFYRSSCSFPACPNVCSLWKSITIWIKHHQFLVLSCIFTNVYCLFPLLLVIHTALLLICRYDLDTKKLRHMKPLPEKLLQSLSGELEFLGPYPLFLSFFFSFLFFLINFFILTYQYTEGHLWR